MQIADKYIFPTELLNQKINKKMAPYIIATGIYKSEEQVAEKWDDEKIHVVYAGTCSQQKGGAIASIKMAEYLDKRYHVHILGKGTDDEIFSVKKEIERVSEVSNALITYDGVLRGKEFNQFLQKCHIGLSTQKPEGIYNNTSFPSKILTYLSNGLDVVSVHILAVEQSAVGGFVFYYDGQKPENIAECVKKIEPLKTKSKKELLDNLDMNLVNDIKKLFLVIDSC